MNTLYRVTCLLILVFLVGCNPIPPEKNQTQNLPSPSGNYKLRIPIEKNKTNPRYSETKVWKLTILNSAGIQEYKDEDSTMVGYLNIYWGWDADDQVWVFNSDNGQITKWTKETGDWVKHKDQNMQGIPLNILPDYAR
jgi:hypothetical protein